MGGCVPKAKRFVDTLTRGNSPAVKEIRVEGDVLHIIVDQGARELPVARIEPEVIEGNVYLFTRHISSVVHQTEFLVDLSHRRLPRDWKNRLYWVERESIPSPFHPFAKDRFHDLQRRKITVN
jgi:hypothetical protein